MKNNKYIILICFIVIATNALSVKITKKINSIKTDTDYQQLGIDVKNYDIEYYTVYHEDKFGIYKVYKLNNYYNGDSSDRVKDQIDNSYLWSKHKFYEYMMMKFYEKIGDEKVELDRENLYYYHYAGKYAIYDAKKAKIYFYKNLLQSSEHEFSEILGIKTKEHISREVYDVRGGLQFDGTDYYVYEFAGEKGKEIIETLENNAKWSKDRLDDNKLNSFKYNKEVSSIKNGYYYYELVCRTSDENKKRNFIEDEATGYEIGVFDADKNILYYYWTSY